MPSFEVFEMVSKKRNKEPVSHRGKRYRERKRTALAALRMGEEWLKCLILVKLRAKTAAGGN